MHARLGILLSGSGTTYENLQEHIQAGSLPAEIVVVVASRAACGGIARAHRLGHPVVVARSPAEVTAALREHGADWVAMCGWLKYWDPPSDFAGRVLNVHPSLLPAHGGTGMYGQHVHTAVLAAGDAESGCTVHEVRGAYDSGPVLGQARVPVLPSDSPESLQQRVQAAERELYPRVLAERIRAAGPPAS
ncbi:MAG: phosphoribosylglycinamide formyltransferase [Planctomycetota bacterium]